MIFLIFFNNGIDQSVIKIVLYVNIEYPLPNGTSAKFLNDEKTYLGNQLESEFGGDRYFGIIADMVFLLVCTYDKDGSNPELVLYKQR